MSNVMLENKTILVTGAAGFIGANLVKRIYQEAPSATVIGIDNMNAYYDVALKEFRLNELAKYPTFTFVKGNIADKELITELFEKYKPSVVVNLVISAVRNLLVGTVDRGGRGINQMLQILTMTACFKDIKKADQV